MPATTSVPDISMLLTTTAHTLTTELAVELAAIGTTPRAYCVLAAAMGQERTQKELAALCALDKTTMVVTLDDLERAGLAERRPCGHDRRARIVAVTPAGAELAERAREIVDGVHADVLAALGEDRDAWMRGMALLAAERLAPRAEGEHPVRRRPPVRTRRAAAS